MSTKKILKIVPKKKTPAAAAAAAAAAHPSSANLTFIDLFCGIGGFHQALHQMGAKCILACDISMQSCLTGLA